MTDEEKLLIKDVLNEIQELLYNVDSISRDSYMIDANKLLENLIITIDTQL